MAIFKSSIFVIDKAEGRDIVNDPNDLGRLSKYGISQRAYPDLDIKNLTFDQAMEVLEKDYWNKYNIGAISNQGVANIVMLITINMSPSSAATIVQKAVNRYFRSDRLVIDGVMGSKTIEAINSCSDPIVFRDCLRLQECQYYYDLVHKLPGQITNLHGWIGRALL